MVYKDNFEPLTLIKSAEQNTNFNIIQNTLFVFGEDLTAQITGEATIFTLPHTYRAGSAAVFVDGLRLRRIFDYSESSSTTITLVIVPLTGQDLICDYIRLDV